MAPQRTITVSGPMVGDHVIILNGTNQPFEITAEVTLQLGDTYHHLVGGKSYRVKLRPIAGRPYIALWIVVTLFPGDLSILHGTGYVGYTNDPFDYRLEINLEKRLGVSIMKLLPEGSRIEAVACHPGDCFVDGCVATYAYPIGATKVCWLHALEIFPDITSKLAPIDPQKFYKTFTTGEK